MERAIRTFKNRFVAGLVSVGEKIDLFVVSDSGKSENKYKFTKNIKKKTNIIGVCANFWNILFQRNAHRTTGNEHHYTLNTNSTCHTEQTWSSGMVYQTIIGTL